MQSIDETSNENIESEHFLNSATSIDNDNTSATTATRTQNFSFASTYQPSTGHFISSTPQPSNQAHHSGPKYPSNALPKATYNFSKPIAAFSVLNNEDFYTSSSFVGSKPNAIVRPIRRPEQTAQQTGKHGQEQQLQPQLPQLQRQQQQTESDTGTTHSPHSQPYQYQLSGSSVTEPQALRPQHPTARSAQNYEHNFAEELNRKLSYLHNRDSHSMPHWTSAGYRHSTHDVGKRAKGKASLMSSLSVGQRPLFITTVPKGVFLPPPKEIPLPAYLRPYVYASHPMVLSAGYNSSYDKSPTFAKDNQRSATAPTAAHDKDFATASTAAPSSQSSSSRMNGQSIRSYAQAVAGGVHLTKEQFKQQIQQHRAKRETTSSSREVPTKEPYKNVMFERRVIRGSNFGINRTRPNFERIEQPVEERRHHQEVLRYRPVFERHKPNVNSQKTYEFAKRDEFIQTDEEPMGGDIKRSAEYCVNTQTELLPNLNDVLTSPDKTCVDKSTEIGENELCFQQDSEYQTLVDFYVDMCFQQAIFELAHEVQVDDLKDKYKTLESQLSTESTAVTRIGSSNSRNEAQDTSAAKLLQGHIAKLVPEVLENLESAAYIEPTKKTEVMKSICPWLTVEVAEEVGHIVDSREILTVIIEEIIKQRAAVYGDVKNMPEIVANIEEIEEITTAESEKPKNE